MTIFSKIISIFMSVIMAILNFFGINQRPDFKLGDVVNSNTAQVLEIYNAAVKKTDNSSPEGVYYYEFKNLEIENKELESLFKSVFKNVFNGEKTEWYDVPGDGTLKADDVKSAKCSTHNGKTTVIIEVKDHTDNINTNANDSSISRAMGSGGNITDIADLMAPITITSGLDTFEIKYTNCKIACIIDDTTGEILYGEWSYTMTESFGKVVMDFNGTPIEISNSTIAIDYIVEI